MEPNSDNGDPVEPRVNEPTTRVDENTGNDNNPEASDVSELEESHDSAWTAHSRSNTTYSSEQAETHDDEVALHYEESSDNVENKISENSVDTEDEDLPSVLTKEKPKHKWCAVKEFTARTWGLPSHKSMESVYNCRVHGSLRFVDRLQLASKMDCHNGCVNALHFNSTGTRLASGSDDLNIIIWDWSRAKPLLNYDSGHRGNVFQAKFLPLSGDMHIVSCARDGHIRLAELSSGGAFHSTRRLGLHRGPAHKLTLLPDTPHVFLTAGEDAVVLEVDVRQSKPSKLLTVKKSEQKIALYSIASNPIETNEFCVGGRDQFVRVYDRRRIDSSDHSPSLLRKFCPRQLLDSSVRAHVTCAIYNYNGSEILASYNDEDIYSFSSSGTNVSDYLHRYQGHRNNATVKGVSYYGPQSEFVVSGSDCGNIFFWDRETEAIVQCVVGDQNGVVNCLEPHPSIPVLATSGLDDDVKIWSPIWFPTAADGPQLWDLKNTVKTNQREREEERRREPDTIDGEMLWILWRHIRRTERRRRQQNRTTSQEGAEPATLSSSSEESDESGNEESGRGVQCAPS